MQDDPTPPNAPARRILIVDDHPIVRKGLASLIEEESDLSVCGEAGDPARALEILEVEQPDLVLVDLSLGEESGVLFLRQLAERGAMALVVSMHEDPSWVERSLAAGARGYVLKSGATREVVSAIRRLLSGGLWVSESLHQHFLEERFAPGRGAADAPERRLSERELEVFEQIGRGRSTHQIGEDLGVSPKTVQTYRERIKEKLGLDTSAELASRATRWVLERSG